MKKLLISLGLVTAFGLSACGDDGGNADMDTGVTPGEDGGTPPVDTGTPAPDTGVNPPDAGIEMADIGFPDRYIPDIGEPDAGPPPPDTVTVSGQLVQLGYYLNADTRGIGNAAIVAYGVNPPPMVTTDPNVATVGQYSIDVPANGNLIFFTQPIQPAAHYPTYTAVTTQDQAIVNKNLYAAEAGWIDQLAADYGVDLNAGPGTQKCHAPPDGNLDANDDCVYAIVVGQVLDDGTEGAGTKRPVAGIRRNDDPATANVTEGIQFTGGGNDGKWYVKGPYWLDYTGTSSLAVDGTPVNYSVRYNDNGNYRGGYFVAFAEIPLSGGGESIDLKMQITYPYNNATRYFGPNYVKAFRRNGVSISKVYESGTPVDQPPVDVDFDTQVYPLFLPINQGGLGCQGCHTDQGGAQPAAGMSLYGADNAYNNLTSPNYPMRAVCDPDPATAMTSYVLQRPLYEANGVQDHPIFAFASPADPGYQLILTWLTEGCERNVVVPPVSFTNEVLPLLAYPPAQGGAGCYGCHTNVNNPVQAPAGFYMSQDPAELYNELTNETPTDTAGTGEYYRVNVYGYPERSMILVYPLTNGPYQGTHPVNIFANTADPRYQLLYRWIDEGYNYN